MIHGRTADESSDDVSFGEIEPSEDQLDEGDRGDDGCLNQIPPVFFPPDIIAQLHGADLLGQMAHNDENGCGVERLQWNQDEDLQVAKTITRPPLAPVVVRPDQGVDDCDEVQDDDVDDEDSGGKLAAPAEQSKRNPTEQVSDDGEKDPADQVGPQSVSGSRRIESNVSVRHWGHPR